MINYYREQKALEILKFYDIDEHIAFSVKKVTKKFPYHNIQHIYSVIINLSKMFDFNMLSYEDQKCLIIAALFHDADYSYTGKNNDHKNIKKSIKFFNDRMSRYLNKNEMLKITNLIKSTFIDNVYRKENTDLLESLIQDADIMTNFEKDANIFWQGLSQEIGENINLETTIDFLEKYNVKNKNNKKLFEYEINKLKNQL